MLSIYTVCLYIRDNISRLVARLIRTHQPKIWLLFYGVKVRIEQTLGSANLDFLALLCRNKNLILRVESVAHNTKFEFSSTCFLFYLMVICSLFIHLCSQ